MPWRYMVLRNQRVLARCNEDGSLADEGGRVEIRYKPNDGRKYAAAARNLSPTKDATILPDDHCSDAEAPPPKDASAGDRAAPGTSPAKGRAPKASASVAKPPTAAEPGEVIAYADGACSGNPGPAGLGVVMLDGDTGTRTELAEYLGRGTNNIAELTAILRAAEAMADPKKKLRVFTDSNYSIGVLTKGWKAKANQELVAEVKSALARLDDVRLFHVPGHAGVELNERADQLAVAAVESRSTSGWTTVKR
jgi:ribonuclease HI